MDDPERSFVDPCARQPDADTSPSLDIAPFSEGDFEDPHAPFGQNTAHGRKHRPCGRASGSRKYDVDSVVMGSCVDIRGQAKGPAAGDASRPRIPASFCPSAPSGRIVSEIQHCQYIVAAASCPTRAYISSHTRSSMQAPWRPRRCPKDNRGGTALSPSPLLQRQEMLHGSVRAPRHACMCRMNSIAADSHQIPYSPPPAS